MSCERASNVSARQLHPSVARTTHDRRPDGKEKLNRHGDERVEEGHDGVELDADQDPLRRAVDRHCARQPSQLSSMSTS